MILKININNIYTLNISFTEVIIYLKNETFAKEGIQNRK